MRAPSVKVTRRYLIGIIVLTFISVLFNYLQTWRKRSSGIKPAPQILGSEMKRSAKNIEYSDYRNGVLRFKIHAQLLTENREGKSLLEGIEAFDFNPDGSIRNEIRSQKADYDEHDPARKTADFSGDVRLFISKRIELRMDSLHYDLGAGIGSTPDLVRVFSDQIKGSARGLRFDRQQQSLALASGIDLTLAQRLKKETKAENLHATSERAYCSQTAHRILLEGKVHIDSDTQALSGESVEAELDAGQKRIRSVTAIGSAAYKSNSPDGTRILSGDRIDFGINPSGALEKIHAAGQASFSSATGADEQHLQGGEIDMEFDDKELPSQVKANTGVTFHMKRATGQVQISGDQFAAGFVAGTGNLENIQIRNKAKMVVDDASGGSELQGDEIRMSLRSLNGRSVLQKVRAEGAARYISKPAKKSGALPEPERTLSASRLELFQSEAGDYLESGSASGNVVMVEKSTDETFRPQLKRMYADNANFQFFPGNNRLKELDADGHVWITYRKTNGSGKSSGVEEFHTASEKMKAVFELIAGESVVKSVSQWGKFSYKDGSRSASSGRCDYDAGSEILVLKESTPKISDETKTTTGEQIVYDRKGKLLLVHGAVRSTILSAQKGSPSFFGTTSSSSPGNVKADEMRYWTDTGIVRYTGSVYLLSENQNLQADRLEISNGLDRVDAQGSVLHLLSMKDASQSPQTTKSREVHAADTSTTVQSSAMTYSKEKNTITYSGKVTLHSKDVDLSADKLDAIPDSEGKKIERAVARGKVTVHVGVREFKGEAADYYASPEKFVMTGKPATVNDPGSGRSASPRLTYTTADDRILLEK